MWLTAETSDDSKIQFDDLLKIAKYFENRKVTDAFLKFNYKKDCLDELLYPFLLRLSDAKELGTACKFIFVLSHDQSFTEGGFFYK